MQLQSIKSIRKLGIQNTLDFEVDNKDHNFYAEGIVVSNSHSLGVSKLGALTVWAKYKHPLEFYKACLNATRDLPNPTEEIALIQYELQFFSIKLLPPHILKSQDKFIMEDGNIRFPLYAIKGISEKTIEKLRGFCHPYSNKFEIFSAAQECKLSIAVTSSIINCGAMDDFLTNHSRAHTVKELALYNLLTPREQQRILLKNENNESILGKQFNYDLIEIIKHLSKPQDVTNKPFIKESRLETLRAEFKPYIKIYEQNCKNENLCNYWFEKSLLGFSYSQNLFDILSKEYDNLMKISECKGELDDTKVTIGGEIIELKEGISKNKNKYIKIKINDSTDSFGPMIMGKNFDMNNELNNGRKLEVGDIVCATGRKKTDIIFCDKIVNQNVKILTRISQTNKE